MTSKLRSSLRVATFIAMVFTLACVMACVIASIGDTFCDSYQAGELAWCATIGSLVTLMLVSIGGLHYERG